MPHADPKARKRYQAQVQFDRSRGLVFYRAVLRWQFLRTKRGHSREAGKLLGAIERMASAELKIRAEHKLPLPKWPEVSEERLLQESKGL